MISTGILRVWTIAHSVLVLTVRVLKHSFSQGLYSRDPRRLHCFIYGQGGARVTQAQLDASNKEREDERRKAANAKLALDAAERKLKEQEAASRDVDGGSTRGTPKGSGGRCARDPPNLAPPLNSSKLNKHVYLRRTPTL